MSYYDYLEVLGVSALTLHPICIMTVSPFPSPEMKVELISLLA